MIIMLNTDTKYPKATDWEGEKQSLAKECEQELGLLNVEVIAMIDVPYNLEIGNWIREFFMIHFLRKGAVIK